MPFKSERQRRYMWVHHPRVARRWTEEYGSTPRGRVAGAMAKRKGYGR